VQTAAGTAEDPNKLIRGATLSALQRMDARSTWSASARCSKTPRSSPEQGDRCRHQGDHPETIRYSRGLKDENENARRAAVEVLNEVGNARSVKHLLEALKDSDCGSQPRGHALGKIGGPRVIDAVLQLVRDKDEDIRRAAIEILNQTKDERAVESLIQATTTTTGG